MSKHSVTDTSDRAILPAEILPHVATFPVGQSPDGALIHKVKWGALKANDKIKPDPGDRLAVKVCDRVVIVDLDYKKGKDGYASLEAFEEETGRTLPDTFCTHTRNGGMHLYYLLPEGVRVAGRVGWREGIDIVGSSGSPQVAYVYPGEGEITECPAWFIEKLDRAKPKADVDTSNAPEPDEWWEPNITEAKAELRADGRLKGEYAESVKLAFDGMRFIRAAGGTKGPVAPHGVDDFIVSMLMFIAGRGRLCEVRGEHMVRVLLAAAFSHLADDDAELGNEVYDLTKWVTSYDNATAKVRAERAEDEAIREAAIGHLEATKKALATGENEEALHYFRLAGRDRYFLQDPNHGILGPFDAVDARLV